MTREIDETPQVKHGAMNGVQGKKNIYNICQRERDKEGQRVWKEGVIIDYHCQRPKKLKLR